MSFPALPTSPDSIYCHYSSLTSKLQPPLSHIFCLTAAVVADVLNGKNLNASLEKVFQNHRKLESIERASIQDLSYNVFRYYALYHALSHELLRQPTKNKTLESLLLIAIHRLQARPNESHTTVNQAVIAAKKLNRSKGAKDLVNAVLRNLLRNKDSLLSKVGSREPVIYQHPQWWIDNLKSNYPAHWRDILTISNQHPPFALRINRRQTNMASYLKLLDQNGIQARKISGAGLMLDKAMSVETLPGFREGLVSVQDIGAQRAAELLDLQNDLRVLDACAAPGGKTGHLLELANIDLTALDCDAQRLTKVKENLDRLKLTAKLIQADATTPAQWWDHKTYDRILADVPCSASGISRRHPDIKWLRRKTDLAQFALLQKKILHQLWQILSPGGKLLYVTCSVFREENALQIENFLLSHSDAHLLALPDGFPLDGQLFPSAEHDGFFYALLQKKK